MRRALLTLVVAACTLPLGVASAGYRPIDLSLTLRASATTIRVGDRVSYTATLRNRGPGPAEAAGVGFELNSPKVADEGLRASGGFCRLVPGAGADAVCEQPRPDLPAGAELRFLLAVRAEAPGRLRIYVSDFSKTAQGNRLNDTAVAVTRILPR
jgi:hypothetical protein